MRIPLSVCVAFPDSVFGFASGMPTLMKEVDFANSPTFFLQFADEAISGEALVALQHSDLKEMGMGSVGHRLKVLKAVYDIKTKQSISIEADHYVPLCK